MLEMTTSSDEDIFRLDQETIYDMVGQQNRNRSRKYLRDIQIYILNLIHKCDLFNQRQNAQLKEKDKKVFIGLNQYMMQIYLKRAGVSPDAVRENLSRLHMLGLVKKKKHRQDNQKHARVYYTINKKAFPCRYGKWIFLPTVQLSHIYLIPCAKYPFCPCWERSPNGKQSVFNPAKCVMPKQLRSLIKELPSYLEWLEDNIEDFPRPKRVI
jgi:hypothetical protein